MKNSRGLIALLVFAFAVWSQPLQAKQARVFRFEADTVRVLRNPLNGWVMYLNRNWDSDFWEKSGYDAMKTSEGTTVRVSDYASTAYLRTSWASLEPEEGHYAWRDPQSRIWRLFRSLRERNMRIALRIVVDGRDQGQNTPIYVIDAGAEYYTSENGRHKSPYPDDPVFQQKYAKFLRALAEDFNDPDKVDFIDAFGLGKWGESHAMIYKDPANKVAVFDWITSLYSETFTRVPLVIHYHRVLADSNRDSWGEVSPDTERLLDMAIGKGYCLRHDAFGMTDYYQTWEKEFARKWNFRLPILMEGGWITAAHHRYWIDSSGNYRQGHSEDVRRGEFEASREAHVNTMDFRINDEVTSWFSQTFDLVKRFVAEGGYRLYPSEVRVPERVRSNGRTRVRSCWNNIGWGYCPTNLPQWNQCYKVAFALLDKDLKPAYVFTDYDTDLSTWLKGRPAVYETTIDLDGVVCGTYTWAVGLVDTRKEKTIGLDMAVDDSLLTADKWLKLGRVEVE